MSKIGKRPIAIPEGVAVEMAGRKLKVKGPKGALELDLHKEVKLEIEENKITVNRAVNNRQASAIWGLTRALVSNILTGVKDGYEKKLELQGVGFRMSIQGKKLVMALGFSHPVEIEIPEGLAAKIEEGNVLSISGIEKQKVGQFAANVRALKEVEPYKGKGFRYVGEKVRRKAGKKAGTTK
jgi:large subunit ribosomal protein L6